MGIYITLGIVFALFIGAAYIAARLQDKLQKERNLVKNLLNDIAYLKAQLKLKGEQLMNGNTLKLDLGHTLAEIDDGMPNSITDCEAYGMVGGCDEYCPVLIAGKCKLQDTDNKDLYKLTKGE